MGKSKGRPKSGEMQRQMISLDSRHVDALRKLSVKRLGVENISGLLRLLATEALIEAGLINE